MWAQGPCIGQFDTMNINSYIFSNEDGTGPGASAQFCSLLTVAFRFRIELVAHLFVSRFGWCEVCGAFQHALRAAGMVNLCVRAPAGKSFVDGAYHTCVTAGRILYEVNMLPFCRALRYVIEWHTGEGTTQSGIRYSPVVACY